MAALKTSLGVKQDSFMSQFMTENELIFKECLRGMQVEIHDTDENEKVPEYLHLTAEQLRNSQVAFIDHCDTFNCFYIDLNHQLQKISLTQSDLKSIQSGSDCNELDLMRKDLADKDKLVKDIQVQINQVQDQNKAKDA